MSWSATFDLDAADANVEFQAHPQVGYAEQESKDAIAAAIVIARGIVSDGLAGVNGPYKVELSGHANPDGVPQDSWATDTITVRVTGSRPTEEPTA